MYRDKYVKKQRLVPPQRKSGKNCKKEVGLKVFSRDSYYRKGRDIRKIIPHLEASSCVIKSNREYKTCRSVLYKILPYLFGILSCPKDWTRLMVIQDFYRSSAYAWRTRLECPYSRKDPTTVGLSRVRRLKFASKRSLTRFVPSTPSVEGVRMAGLIFWEKFPQSKLDC